MPLGTIMHREVAIIRSDATFQEGARCRSVDDPEGRPSHGVITDRDITVRAIANEVDPDGPQVRCAVAVGLSCEYETTAHSINGQLDDYSLAPTAPVLNRDHELAGSVSFTDLVHAIDGICLAGLT